MRIMIAGGGTGGHIFPGIAIAEAIERQAPGVEVFFMGRRSSIEERVVGSTGRAFVAVPAMGFARGVHVRNLAMPIVVKIGYLKALAALSGRRPAAAVGTGGFASVPPILAARTLGIPVVLQEQNSYPGLATRILSRFAAQVHVSFEDTKNHLPRAREIVFSGNPVRAAFSGIDAAGARKALGLSQDGPVVLFLGGSRGAHTINEAVISAAPRLARAGIELVVQTGRDDLATVSAGVTGREVRAVVRAFFDDVATAYAACDLVVSRAGATAISELTLVGRPSILVPYPHATEAHQMKNARALESAGAAVVVPDGELTGAVLADRIEELLSDRARLAAMADATGALARPEAADRVARAVLVLAAGARSTGGGQRSLSQ